MTCTVVPKGQAAQSSPIADLGDCRLKASLAARGFGGLSVEFQAASSGVVDPSNSGELKVTPDPEGRGRNCTSISLQTGTSGLMCTKPLIR